MQIRIPQLQHRLLLKPPFIYQQSIYNARRMFLSTGLFRRFHDPRVDDPAVGFGDAGFFQLAGHAFFDQVAEADGDFCDFGRGDCGGDCVFVVGGEDWWVLDYKCFCGLGLGLGRKVRTASSLISPAVLVVAAHTVSVLCCAMAG